MKSKIKFGIARRLTLYVTTCLLLFVIVMGSAFSVLLYINSKSAYETNLKSIAAGIGEMVLSIARNKGSFTIGGSDDGLQNGQAEIPEDGELQNVPPDLPDGGELQDRPSPGDENMVFTPDGEVRMSGAIFAKLISKLTNATVWLVAPDESGESYDMMFLMRNEKYTDVEFDHLGDQQKQAIGSIFDGSKITTEAFSNLFSESTISVGEPIFRIDGTVMGAVLIHASSAGIFDDMKSGLITMGVSIIAALVIGFLVAITMSKNFTKPLLKINDTATMISEGDYSARTEVRRNDEIGVLAETVDNMGEKLDRANAESEKLEKLRQDFIANISHELRTPVTVMRGSLEALCDGVVKDPELVENYHGEMLKESKYMQRLVNDLLDLSRLQNPDFSINIAEFNLYDSISDAVRSARRVADGRSVKVDFEYDTADFPFKGDYDRVRQMLLIVLDNAVKFTEDPDKPVTVALHSGVLTVTNTGKGIDSSELPYIFDRFYRSRSETNKNGTGLGLAIARQIAVRHGIGISVRSVPGGETTFIFDFIGGGVA